MSSLGLALAPPRRAVRVDALRVDRLTCAIDVGLPGCSARRVVCRDATFALRRGEALVVSGTRGCGRTTLLQSLAGMRRPTRGAVAWPSGWPPARVWSEDDALDAEAPLLVIDGGDADARRVGPSALSRAVRAGGAVVWAQRAVSAASGRRLVDELQDAGFETREAWLGAATLRLR